MKKITLEQIEEAHEYMKNHWVDGREDWSNFAIMEQQGDTEMLADSLINAGAIDSNSCYPECAHIEKVIESLAKRYSNLSNKKQLKRINQVFKDCFVSSCNECNAVQFLADGNEELYPSVKTECWECGSKDIETKIWE